MKKILLILLALCLTGTIAAQPAKRRVAETKQKVETDRATLQFPTAVDMPEDMVWKRDIYRQLDLVQDKNAPLYYPVEPHGRDINVFTLMFRLMLDNKIPVYEYGLDGNESFAESNRVDPKTFLEKYGIYYEMNGDRIMVSNSDIPSRDVKRMYIKESVYFDQRTSTFHTKVTALCPVLLRDDEFGSAATPYPLFWVNYQDVASYFARHAMMSSNYNNVSNLTAEDFFSMNRYDGTIYKTTNMQGLALANYCKTDSALVKEQKRIEQELVDVENHVWGVLPVAAESSDSLTAASAVKESKQTEKKEKSSRRKKTTAKTKSSSVNSSSNAAPRVSVRRERR